MTYLRYTFTPGFVLILLVSFTFMFCTSVVLYFSGNETTSGWVLLAWLICISLCMFSSFVGYRRFKQFGNEHQQNQRL